MTKHSEDEKVVDVRVKDFDGLWNNYEATVTTSDGNVATGYGTTEAEAINSATYDAKKK